MSDIPNIECLTLKGDEWIGEMTGLARMTPYCYIGSHSSLNMTVTGYNEEPKLKHFRVHVSELEGRNSPAKRNEGSAIFELDTRNLYFGHNLDYVYNHQIVLGEKNEGWPEGNVVKGLPVKLQQVHFRAFNPSGISDERSAYFLVSDPVGGFNANSSFDFVGKSDENFLRNDYDLHDDKGQEESFRINDWSEGSSKEARKTSSMEDSFPERLIIGDPLCVAGIDRFRHGDYENERNDYFHILDPDPKNNTYKAFFDSGSLIVKQHEKRRTVDGHAYQYPFDVVVSSRCAFATGYPRHLELCGGVEGTDSDDDWPDNFDSVKLDFYEQPFAEVTDNPDKWRPEAFLLTRPDPSAKFDVLTSYDGTHWVSNEVPVFFAFKVYYNEKDSNAPNNINVTKGYVYINGARYGNNDIPKHENQQLPEGNYLYLHATKSSGADTNWTFAYNNTTDWEQVKDEENEENKYFLIAYRGTACGKITQHQLGDIHLDQRGGGSSVTLSRVFVGQVVGSTSSTGFAFYEVHPNTLKRIGTGTQKDVKNIGVNAADIDLNARSYYHISENIGSDGNKYYTFEGERSEDKIESIVGSVVFEAIVKFSGGGWTFRRPGSDTVTNCTERNGVKSKNNVEYKVLMNRTGTNSYDFEYYFNLPVVTHAVDGGDSGIAENDVLRIKSSSNQKYWEWGCVRVT